MYFADDEVFSDHHHINFCRVVPHSWRNFGAMWKNLYAEYEAALSQFTLSGTHLSAFYEFSNE